MYSQDSSSLYYATPAIEYLKQAINLNSEYREKAKIEPSFKAIREDEGLQQLING